MEACHMANIYNYHLRIHHYQLFLQYNLSFDIALVLIRLSTLIDLSDWLMILLGHT